jgi:hypothetical protein
MSVRGVKTVRTISVRNIKTVRPVLVRNIKTEKKFSVRDIKTGIKADSQVVNYLGHLRATDREVGFTDGFISISVL